jgi:hypothetical protein
MTTATKRKKLQDVINAADDKKVEAIYTMVEEKATKDLTTHMSVDRKAKFELMKQASTDPLFLADLEEIKADFEFLDK